MVSKQSSRPDINQASARISNQSSKQTSK